MICLTSGRPESDLLDMIWRRAPVLMRCGALISDSGPVRNGPISDELKERFAEALRAGKSVPQIARRFGVHYQTVIHHTREVRKEIGYSGKGKGGSR